MLKAILASLDGLSAEIKALYKPADGGKFILNVEAVDGFGLENTEELKGKLTTAQTENAALKSSAEAFKDLDPAAARAALTKVAEFEKLDPAKDADKIIQTRLDQQKAELQAGFNKELEALKASNTALTSQTSSLLIRDAANSALAEHKGNATLLMPHIKSALKTEVKDGEIVLSVIKEDGTAALDNAGNPLSVSGFVAGLKANKDLAGAFEGSGHSGSGRSADKGGGKGVGAAGDIGGDKAQRMQALRAKHPELA